jgi:glycosyltransferase involved in cell wall biosynthesis
MSELVTFVIPTIGRDTLVRTVESLRAQTDDDWRAVIVADGRRAGLAVAALDVESDRITVVTAPATGSAGLTRNFALPWIDSVYTGFVDDDDVLEPEYVERLRSANGRLRSDVVVFRMDHPELGVLPDPEEPRIEWGQVGISFAVRSVWFTEYGLSFIREQNVNDRFGSAANEDIRLLTVIQRLHGAFHLSDYLGYRVRPGGVEWETAVGRGQG